MPTARRATRSWAPLLDAELLENVSLPVSELVPNSIRYCRHARGGGGGAARHGLPRSRARGGRRPGAGIRAPPRGPDQDSHSGWGLYLVDQLSDRWGVSRTDGTAAWFEIDR